MPTVSFDNYTVWGDVAVVAICSVIVILLISSYVSRTRSFSIFMTIVFHLVAAAGVNIAYHFTLLANDPDLYTLVYVLRILYQALLFNVFFLFALYTTVVSKMEHKKARIVAVISCLVFVGIIGTDIVRTVLGSGFRITADGTVVNRTNIFMIGYILYVVILAVLLYRVRDLLFRRVLYGFYGTMAVSLIIRFGQLAFNQSSLNTMTYVFPVIAMLYIMHSNPYDVALGTVDNRAMEDMVRNMYLRKAPFLIMSLLLPDFDEESKELPDEVKALVRKKTMGYFKNGVLFQISNGHLILIAPLGKNPDYEARIEKLLVNFNEYFEKFRYPFKIVIGESIDEISRKNEYASFIKSIQRSQQENTVRRVCPEDIARFNCDEYILGQLTDIYNKHDMDDERVLAFCQPVYNIVTGQFNSAEALMRLKLDNVGIVYPDRFISVAEDHGYIHVLTEIILNKTCREIRRLVAEGYRLNRISVNVSVLELKDDCFCKDINSIIDKNSIKGDKVAIELTETRNESDFIIMKRKIEELRKQGIQFYLDDFGTGYSNMERIMELPFDIIKFDRSLVIASGTGERSERIVENLAHVFKDMDYKILYEGVENDVDEERCREMSASFLQGYKYSRPVPIEELREFLPKAS